MEKTEGTGEENIENDAERFRDWHLRRDYRGGGRGSLRQHFWIWSYPWGGSYIDEVCSHGRPMELRIHGYELTLRLADGEKVEIAPPGR